MRRIPPLSAVRVFESAARHTNFTRAASELGMTQAAVSYQIKLLEERLRTKLFLRHKKGLSLTEIGSRIAPLVSGGFDALEQAFNLAMAEDSQTLTISTTPSFAANWLAPRIGEFQLLEPQLAVRLRADNHNVDFAAEDVDVVIRHGSGKWPGLAALFLVPVRFQPFASPNFIARHDPIEKPSDLIGLPRLSPDDWWWGLWFAGVGLDAGSKAALPSVSFDSQAMEATAAMAGHGIAILNSEMWRADIAGGRLVPVGPSVTSDEGYWLAYPDFRKQSPKIKAFRNWIEKEVGRAEDC
jgi:LysR family transcriptional regulator, glycine cleavage system transcriptional activator